MIAVRGNSVRFCDGLSRRDVLRIGGLSVAGLSLPDLLRAEAASGPKREKACILFFLQGGQSQLDVWDMKPEAPEGIRGPFKPIATNVAGIRITEHLPLLAKMADRFAIIRSVTHASTNHNPGSYRALTAGIPRREDFSLAPSLDDMPHPGSVVSLLAPTQRPVPTFVQLSSSFVGDAPVAMPGLGAGVLGARYEPLKVTGDPGAPDFSAAELALPTDLSGQRFAARRDILKSIEGAFPLLQQSAEVQRLDAFYQRAFALVTSPEARRAFDLSQEPGPLRDRYGRHVHGQRLLLARRLIEAGVRLVTVYWGGPLNAPDDYWDTHKANFPKQKDHLLPPFDQCLSALLEDLHQRGLLKTTLVIAMGEFGRTPRIGQVTANAETDATGRDHWPFCYSIVVAGGGTRGGQVIGASDDEGAYPADRPVTPEDFTATVYHALGLDLNAQIRTQENRPLPITRGEPVRELWGEG
jgi:hypothetical protein